MALNFITTSVRKQSRTLLLARTQVKPSLGATGRRSPLVFAGLATTGPRWTGNTRGEGATSSVKKPDLRRAGVNYKQQRVVALVSALALLFMYPMIFRPLFGFGSLGKFALSSSSRSSLEVSPHFLKLLSTNPSPFPAILLKGEDQSKTMKEAGIDLDKLRPNFMPRWSNPFAPKDEPKDE